MKQQDAQFAQIINRLAELVASGRGTRMPAAPAAAAAAGGHSYSSSKHALNRL